MLIKSLIIYLIKSFLFLNQILTQLLPVINILVLTRYDSNGPSSRYRFYQFFPSLNKENLHVSVSPLFNERYVRNLYSSKRKLKIFNPINSFLKRTAKILLNRKYDLVWMEKEILPWIPASIEKFLLKSSIPCIIDYDDAIYHRYDQHPNFLIRMALSNKIEKLMLSSNVIIVGNQYIAEYAVDAGAKQVEILPTVVDTNIYTQKNYKGNSNFTIGWIGSPTTSPYVKVAIPALNQLCQNSDVNFSAIGALKKDMVEISVQLIPWLAETEVQELNRFDVGIMPLPDTPWERGKCGFKLIQYMAAGLPVIASPVGINTEIVDHGITGFLASTTEDWVKYLRILKDDSELRRTMGIAGRRIVEEKYSLEMVAPKLISIFKEAVEA
jgi:glycosyltransferase involved in cell wall biosynthesis